MQSVVPSGTAGLSYIESTSVLHTKDGDLYFASSAVANLSTPSDGEFTSVDRITGGTGEWTGASGYLQSRGFVANGADVGDFVGKVVLP
ncbi:MAG: hypothetical protein ABR540_09920 [Acidimicrobiales bacterium]